MLKMIMMIGWKQTSRDFCFGFFHQIHTHFLTNHTRSYPLFEWKFHFSFKFYKRVQVFDIPSIQKIYFNTVLSNFYEFEWSQGTNMTNEVLSMVTGRYSTGNGCDCCDLLLLRLLHFDRQFL